MTLTIEPCRRTKKRSTAVKEDWTPSQHLIGQLTKRGYGRQEIDGQVERFVDWHRQKGTVASSWDAAFRNWMRKAREFAARDATKQQDEDGVEIILGQRIEVIR